MLRSTEIAMRLSSQSVGGIAPTTSAWRIVFRGLQETPDKMIAITPSGGIFEEPNSGFDRPTFQVLVRGSSTSGSELEAKVEDVIAALDDYDGTPSTGSNAAYIDIEKEGDVLYLGLDENRRPIYSINFLAMRMRV